MVDISADGPATALARRGGMWGRQLAEARWLDTKYTPDPFRKQYMMVALDSGIRTHAILCLALPGLYARAVKSYILGL